MASFADGKWVGAAGVLAMLSLAAGTCAVGQVSKLREPSTPVQALVVEPTIEGELHLMSSAAAVIFAGQVLSVEHKGGTPEAVSSGWVEIEFQVEEAIRGCVAQGTYTLREWAGLWTGGVQRYRVGQRLLMMLHAPGLSGFSSPVGGQDGAIPILGAGAAPRPGDSFVAAGEKAVDLRWIEARLARVGSAAEGSMARLRSRAIAREQVLVGRERTPLVTRKAVAPGVRSNIRLNGASAASAGFTGGVSVSSDAVPAEGTSLRGLLALLGSWEGQQSNVAR